MRVLLAMTLFGPFTLGCVETGIIERVPEREAEREWEWSVGIHQTNN